MLAEKLKEKKDGLGYKFQSLCVYSEEQSMHLIFDLNASDGHPKNSAAKNSLKQCYYDNSSETNIGK